MNGRTDAQTDNPENIMSAPPAVGGGIAMQTRFMHSMQTCWTRRFV